MEHGGEAAESTDLSLAGAVQGGEANMSRTYHGQLGAATARRAGIDGFQPSAAAYRNSTMSMRHVRSVPVAVFRRESGPGVEYANIGASWRQLAPIYVVLVEAQLPGGVVPVHHNYGYSTLQPRRGAVRGVVQAALLSGGVSAVYNWDDALQPRPGTGHGEVLVDLLSEAEVFVDLLPGGGVTVHDDYGYYPWQPRPGAGRGEVFIGSLPDGVGMVFVNLGNFAQQNLLGTGRADGIGGMLRDPNLGAGYDGSGSLAVFDNPIMVGEHLRRLLPFARTGACSVAVNGLAAGPGSPAVAFHLFVLLLAGLFLVMLHVLGV